MTSLTDVLRLPSRPPRLAAVRRIRLRDYPVIPLLILGSITFVAIFANQLAPHNPEVGILSARFKPPFWVTGGSSEYLQPERLRRLCSGHRFTRPADRPECGRGQRRGGFELERFFGSVRL